MRSQGDGYEQYRNARQDRQLLEDIRPEAAIVSLPNALHVPAALSCMRLGIPALVAINGTWFVRKHERYFDAQWWRQEGGGPFLINLIHDIDCFRFMCAEIQSVQAMASNALRGFPVEDAAALSMRFQSGAVGSMVLSDAVPSPWAWDLESGQAPYFPYTPADCYIRVCRRWRLRWP
jgi:predicted dehydrogenase